MSFYPHFDEKESHFFTSPFVCRSTGGSSEKSATNGGIHLKVNLV